MRRRRRQGKAWWRRRGIRPTVIGRCILRLVGRDEHEKRPRPVFPRDFAPAIGGNDEEHLLVVVRLDARGVVASEGERAQGPIGWNLDGYARLLEAGFDDAERE